MSAAIRRRPGIDQAAEQRLTTGSRRRTADRAERLQSLDGFASILYLASKPARTGRVDGRVRRCRRRTRHRRLGRLDRCRRRHLDCGRHDRYTAHYCGQTGCRPADRHRQVNPGDRANHTRRIAGCIGVDDCGKLIRIAQPGASGRHHARRQPATGQTHRPAQQQQRDTQIQQIPGDAIDKGRVIGAGVIEDRP